MCGYDGGGKKINARKRHLLVDTEGLVIGVAVHEANIADRDGAKALVEKVSDQLPLMEKIWADRGYNGKIGEWIREQLGWTLQIVKPPRRWVRVPAGEEPPPWVGFTVLPWLAQALGDRAHDRVDLT